MTITTFDTDKMDGKVTPETETQNVSSEVSDCDNSSIDSSINSSMESSSEDLDDWKNVLSTSLIKKRVIKRSEKSIHLFKGDLCKVDIFGRLDNGTLVEQHVDVWIQLGDLEVVQVLERTIAKMNLNEVAEIKIDPEFAYGERGTDTPYRIPPNATITYTVELKEIKEEPKIETLSISKRKEIGIKRRERGNWWFNRRDFRHAIECYQRALQYLVIDKDTKWNKNKETETVTDTELQALLEDCIKVYINLSAALIETKAYDKALEYVNIVLHHEPFNTNALFKKGRIFKYQGEYGKAYGIFLESLMIEPESIAVDLELESLKEKISRENKKENYLYAKILGININEDDFIDKLMSKNETVEDYLYAKIQGININKDGSIDKPMSKNETVEDKSKIDKKIMWTLLGASAVVVGILAHRFAS